MNERNRAAGLGAVAGIVVFAAILAFVGIVFVYSGLYNAAASDEHASLTRWALDTTFHNSIRRRAQNLVQPDKLTAGPEGASGYKAMRQHCHAGPGVEHAEWAVGMRSRPPRLTEAASDWSVEKIFWLVKHGAKMTGMPAFGPTHQDAMLWRIAAFVKSAGHDS